MKFWSKIEILDTFSRLTSAAYAKLFPTLLSALQWFQSYRPNNYFPILPVVQEKLEKVDEKLNQINRIISDLRNELMVEREENRFLSAKLENVTKVFETEMQHSVNNWREDVTYSTPEYLLDDKTGMADYALESAGAEIIDQLTTSGRVFR